MNLPVKQTEEIDSVKAGQIVRSKRLAKGLSLRSLAKAMGFSAPFVSDLELGRRNWTHPNFIIACGIIDRQPKPKRTRERMKGQKQ